MKANMAYVFVIILAGFFACSHSSRVQNSAFSDPRHPDALALKNMVFCECLERAVPLSREQKVSDGSKSGYFQLSNLGEDEIDSTVAFVQTYLDTAVYSSSTNTKLGMMKCIDLYNSNKLDNFVKNVTRPKIG